MKSKLDHLPYHIRKLIETYNLVERVLILSISGGKDSMALLHAFCEIHENWKPLKIQIFHVHHGENTNVEYRNQARDLVRAVTEKYGFPLLTNSNVDLDLTSEEDFRNYRRSEFAKLAPKETVLVTAHHAMDLLETRVHRLIRGTGIGGLTAMQEFDTKKFRPLLKLSVAEIEAYIQKHNISFAQDPTNNDTKYFRNWIRHTLLPSLDAYQAGAVDTLGQSLENIASLWQGKESFFQAWIVNEKIKRQAFTALDQTHQMQILAQILQQKNVNQYRRSQLEEVTKLLDRKDLNYTFEMLGCVWKIDPNWVEIALLD